MAKQIDKIVREWKRNGWEVVNNITVRPSGTPDYLMIKKGEIDCYVESKESWDKLSDIQKNRINQLLRLGKRVFVNDSEIKELFTFEELF